MMSRMITPGRVSGRAWVVVLGEANQRQLGRSILQLVALFKPAIGTDDSVTRP